MFSFPLFLSDSDACSLWTCCVEFEILFVHLFVENL